jgi:putative ABC transport system permease protein
MKRDPLDGLGDDIRDHIDRETRDNIERGMAPDAARLAALRKFGNVALVMEDTRAVWRRVWVDQLLQDLRYSLRFFRRNPRFAAIAVLTMALGIGTNTAVFSVVDAALLKPLAYPNASRLIWVASPDPHIHHDVVWGPDYLAMREHARSYDAIAAYGYQQAVLASADAASQVTGIHTDGDFWKITGTRAAVGRLCAEREQNCLVISWSLFQRQFGGDARVIGHPVSLNGQPAELVGVLPARFRFQFPMWWTETHPEPVEAYWAMPPFTSRQAFGCQVVALLKPGTGLPQAEAEIESLQKHLREGDAQRLPDPFMRVESLQETLTGGARRGLMLILAAGAFVLLIACGNVANLLLARATARQKELAVRAAMGAGRMRLVRQLLAESICLALAGGAAGLLLARWAISILARISPFAVPRLAEAVIDLRVLAFAAAVSIFTGMLFGAAPAAVLWRADLQEALKSATRGTVGLGGLQPRRMLVAVELALAIILLTGAGLMVKSFARMNAHPPGFDPARIIVMKSLLFGRYPTKPAQQAFVDQMLKQLVATPGVRAAGISRWYLWGGPLAFPVDGGTSRERVIRFNAVSADYLKALGVKLVKGRWLADNDTSMALLNESMAREAFGNSDPIGKQLPLPQPTTIVGVVADIQYFKLDAAAPAEAYIPSRQGSLAGPEIAVRVDAEPAAMIPILRARIAAIDPMQPVYDVKTLDQALAASIAPRRFNLVLLGAFAASALLLALIGIYGVIAYSVAERTREIGLRMALGARRGQVAGMVVREGAVIALIGVGVGLAAARGLAHLMTSLLYGVEATDPTVFAAVAVLLAMTAIAASVIPAVRAASIDPTVSLRYE